MLVHGAANSASVWTFWQGELAARGWQAHALDLRGHGGGTVDLSRTSMADYADDVVSFARKLGGRPALVGWSMGGLVAMMAAEAAGAVACVALAPSMPAREIDEAVEPRTGEFGPEEYGIVSLDPERQRGMPDLDLEERSIAQSSLGRESRLARDERRRGVVIRQLPCPLLIVTGTIDRQWPRQRYHGLWLPADYMSVEGASHWGLVLNRRALKGLVPAVVHWIGQQAISCKQ